MRKLGWSTMLAVAAFAAALLVAPTAPSAPNDVADLSVTKSDEPDPVTVGAALTYTAVVTNLGPQEATNVILDDRMPAQSEFVSAAATVGKCEDKGTRVTCSLGNLAKDSSATVTVVVRPTKAGTIDNTAAVDSVETDPVPVNDSATASTRVTGNPGRDVLRGDAGDDRLRGGSGFDRCVGGGGFDRERACER